MIHKYTLKFIYPGQEIKYLIFIKPKIMRELTSFSLYALSFVLLNLLQFIMQESYWYSLVCAISILVIYWLKEIVKASPQLIDRVCAFYQLYILITFEFNSFLDVEDQASKAFAWYYGFQCGFFHFAIYLQGVNYILQSVMLCLVTGAHLYFSNFSGSLGIYNLAMFLFMLLSMMSIKYNFEKSRKEEFFHSYQQRKWEEIVEHAIQTNIFLVSYDKKQDQLQLSKQNTKAKEMFHLTSDADMREFFRNLIVQNNERQLLVQPDTCEDIEKIVRKMLILEKSSSISYITQKIYTKNKITKENYKVKLTHCILNNQLECLIVITKFAMDTQVSQQTSNQIVMEIMNLSLKQSSQLLAYQSIHQQSLEIDQQQISSNYYYHNTIFNSHFLLSKRMDKVKPHKITYEIMKQQFQRVFGLLQFNLIMTQSIAQNFQLLISLVISCSRIITYMNGFLPFITIKIEAIENSTTVFISCYMDSINKQILSLLQENWIRNPSRGFLRSSNYDRTIYRIYTLHNETELPLLVLSDICVIQLILSQFGRHNHLNVEFMNRKLLISFKLMNTARIQQSDELS